KYIEIKNKLNHLITTHDIVILIKLYQEIQEYQKSIDTLNYYNNKIIVNDYDYVNNFLKIKIELYDKLNNYKEIINTINEGINITKIKKDYPFIKMLKIGIEYSIKYSNFDDCLKYCKLYIKNKNELNKFNYNEIYVIYILCLCITDFEKAKFKL